MISLIEEKNAAAAFPGGEPTTFELLTLLAFLIFREAGCEWAVFETGLGGRLDATNVIVPQASVLTIIELEHTEYLGSTIAEIAGEKAGIIKTGVPAFSSGQTAEAETVFKIKAAERNSALFFPDDLIKEIRTLPVSDSAFMQSAEIVFNSGSSYLLNLQSAGGFQMNNASLAVSCLEYLRTKQESGLPKTFDPSAGISRTVLPGRMEIFNSVSDRPMMLLDGAHTLRSVQSAAEAFFKVIGDRNDNETGALLLFGAVDGKNIEGMAKILGPLFNNIIISTPGTFKKSSPEAVYECFGRYIKDEAKLILEKDPLEAFNSALDQKLPVFVTGSFYMAAEIRKLLK